MSLTLNTTVRCPHLMRGISGCRRKKEAVNPYTCRTSSVVSVTRVSDAVSDKCRVRFSSHFGMLEFPWADSRPVTFVDHGTALDIAQRGARVAVMTLILRRPSSRIYRKRYTGHQTSAVPV